MVDTKLTVAIVVGVWMLLSVVMMNVRKRRKGEAADYRTPNMDKALLHPYKKKFSIGGRDLSLLRTMSGENLEKIVALPEGPHGIAGVYQNTEVNALG